MRFEIWSPRKNDWRWRLKAKNGKVIASGEGFKTRRACEHSVDLVKSAGREAMVTINWLSVFR